VFPRWSAPVRRRVRATRRRCVPRGRLVPVRLPRSQALLASVSAGERVLPPGLRRPWASWQPHSQRPERPRWAIPKGDPQRSDPTVASPASVRRSLVHARLGLWAPDPHGHPCGRSPRAQAAVSRETAGGWRSANGASFHVKPASREAARVACHRRIERWLDREGTVPKQLCVALVAAILPSAGAPPQLGPGVTRRDSCPDPCEPRRCRGAGERRPADG
jgi:hypothetical protein